MLVIFCVFFFKQKTAYEMRISDWSSDVCSSDLLAVEAAIHGHEIPHEFPPEVLAQAAAVPVEVEASEAASRVDLRKLPLVTIDGEDAKDFDDAVYSEPNRGGFRLVVAIADVSHYVRPETPLDDEAQKRATSVYFP